MAFHGCSETCPLQPSKLQHSMGEKRNKQLWRRTARPPPQLQWTASFESRSLLEIQSNRIALEGLGGL